MTKASNLFIVLAFAFCIGGSSCGRTERVDQTAVQESSVQSLPAVIDSGPKGSEDENGEIEADPVLSNIQQNYRLIEAEERAGTMDSVAFEYSCGDERRGRITYFSKDKHLLLIVHRYAEYDHHSATDRYYISDGELFFAFLTTVLWSFESGAEGSTRDNFTEHRVYLNKGRPLKCMQKKYTIRSHATSNPKSGDIASTLIQCDAVKPVTRLYEDLISFRKSGGKGCFGN